MNKNEIRELTDAEVEKLVPLKNKAGKSSIRKYAFRLEVGKVLSIPRGWQKAYKYKPATTLGSLLYHKQKKFSVRQNDLDGKRIYAVKRIK